MNRNKALAAAAIAAFALALVALLPARIALPWLAPQNFRPSGVTGTFWRGSMLDAEISSVRLGETIWSVSVPSLLLGRLAADVETHIGDGSASGALAVSLTGNLSCASCRFEGPVASLKPAFPALRNLDGRVQLDLTSLEFRDRWPTRLIASAKLSGVLIGAPGALPSSGGPRANFDASVSADPVPADGVIEVAVKDAGGPVELKARLVLTRPGNFEFAGNAKARADAPPDIARALSVLGGSGPDGTSQLNLSGTF